MSLSSKIKKLGEMKVLLGFGMMGGLGVASSDLYVSLLAKFAQIFSVSSFLMNLTLSLYFVTTALGCITFAYISRFYTHPVIHLIAFLLFISGGVIITLHPYYDFILIGRALQGLGIGLLQTNLISYIKKRYSDTLSQSFSLYSFGSELFCILAPLLGVILAEYFSWQAPFLFITCFSLLLFLISGKNFTHHPPPNISFAPSWKELYKNLYYLKYNGISFLMNGLSWGVITITSYIYESPNHHALFYTGYSSFYALGNYLGSKKNFPKDHLMAITPYILFVLGSGIMWGFFAHQIIILTLAIFFFALLSGLTYGPIMEKSLQTIHTTAIDTASSILVLCRLTSSGLLIALFSYLYFSHRNYFYVLIFVSFSLLSSLFLLKDQKQEAVTAC